MTDEPEADGGPDELALLSALGEPTRRALYEQVVAAGDWVSRDEAADAAGLERGTAAHHLDRLAADGLLEVDYQRRSGRQGPGAGRPAKLYRRARREFEVALPPRDYALAGMMLAEAVDRARVEGTAVTTALDDVARAEGERIGDRIVARLRAKRARRAAPTRRAVVETLAEHGFEPRTEDDGTVVLHNCPFHQLAREHTELICGMNLCLMNAMLERIEDPGLEAQLEPEADQCCVQLHPTDRA